MVDFAIFGDRKQKIVYLRALGELLLKLTRLAFQLGNHERGIELLLGQGGALRSLESKIEKFVRIVPQENSLEFANSIFAAGVAVLAGDFE